MRVYSSPKPTQPDNNTSGVLKDMLYQRRIEDFINVDKPKEPEMEKVKDNED